MVEIDLTTLQGWDDLPDGEYQITVGATAEGYSRIEHSEAVNVVKETPVPVGEYFLTFSSVNGTQFDTCMNVMSMQFGTSSIGISWDGTVEYSTDKTNWNTWDGTNIYSSQDGKLYLRGIGNTCFSDFANGNIGTFGFNITDDTITIDGNIENLLDYATVQNGNHPVMGMVCFAMLFNNCTSISSVSNNLLPATTLSDMCYVSMFSGCSSLTNAPELPALTATQSCYNSMFSDCSSLTNAPSLPATTLAANCYGFMFKNCSSLNTIPALPALTLTDNCYGGIFSGCLLIKVSDTQDIEYINEYRIPTVGTGIEGSNSLELMFTGTGGTFNVNDPQINTTYYTSNQIV